MERSEGEDGSGGSEEESAKRKGWRQDGRRGLRFLFPEIGVGWQGAVRDGVWKIKDFLPDFGEFVMLVGHPRGGEKMFRYMDLGGHRHE